MRDKLSKAAAQVAAALIVVLALSGSAIAVWNGLHFSYEWAGWGIAFLAVLIDFLLPIIRRHGADRFFGTPEISNRILLPLGLLSVGALGGTAFYLHSIWITREYAALVLILLLQLAYLVCAAGIVIGRLRLKNWPARQEVCVGAFGKLGAMIGLAWEVYVKTHPFI